MKVFRDPVHNIISFDKEQEKILLELIESKEFQRLRHIKQLGLSSFTYPGAEHTRFMHSLGVVHLTKRFLDKIISLKSIAPQYKEELREYRLLALVAALLHDIGHGPFSHALEKTTQVDHESWTIEIITGNTEVKEILESHQQGFAGEVADVIKRTHKSRAIVKLLSSQLDTDRIDYLLRDSGQTGAGYGLFDLEWMINCLRIGEVNGDTEIGMDEEKGFSVVEDFVMARNYMYHHVYFHKATRSAEVIVDGIFRRASELAKAGEIELPEDLAQILAKKTADSDTLAHYLNLSEYTVWHCIAQWVKSKDAILADLCTRIMYRRLFKGLSVPDNKLLEFTIKAYEICQQEGKDREYYMVEDTAPVISYKDTYIINIPKKKEGGEEEDDATEASEQIFLFDRKGKAKELSDKSKVINQIRNQNVSLKRIYVPEEIRHKIAQNSLGLE